MATTKRDYYEVLEVEREADGTTITRAYRRLAKQYHPDRNPGDAEAEVKFREITEAHEVLNDPQKRQIYDRYGHAGLQGNGAGFAGGGVDLGDLFDALSGGLFGSQGRRGQRVGRDLQLTVEIDLLEAKRGGEKVVTIPRNETCPECSGSCCKRGTQPSRCRRCNGQGYVQGQGFFRMAQSCPGCGGRGFLVTDPCHHCRGSGAVKAERQVKIPIYPGVDSDMMITLQGEGEGGGPGVGPGDLRCVFRVRQHPLFVREGLDLHCEFPVTFSQAALGGPIEAPTLEGRFVTHALKRGVQSGDEVRIQGLGMPGLRRDGRGDGRVGDLVVHVKVVTPRHLTKRQEELLRELSDLEGSHISPERKSFLERIRAFFAPDQHPPADAV
jgi:molecular chaperone DnaJ